ncbi:hypothetical protein C9374_004016 [Naegleria lovaniensis]|uniref:Uncharacterized protein n=1 Tax=Naegleria lovaniensis TaxID=51637 RepID=A0AA88KSK8_NAELO|nr:uncharacterized protein C9374_004016 [Naegleria lovaniensis]KAG2394252.1 hypothetical protein C9374_004016 [Naegleria lovaniensis]
MSTCVKLILLTGPGKQQHAACNHPCPCNDHEPHLDSLLLLLKQKLGFFGRRFISQPFSMNFECIHTFGQSGVRGNFNHQFNFPTSLAISYQYSFVFICDSFNDRILIFDLCSREFRKSFRIMGNSERPRFLCMEEERMNGDVALIVGCGVFENFTFYKLDVNKNLSLEMNQSSSSNIKPDLTRSNLNNNNKNSSSSGQVCEMNYIWKSMNRSIKSMQGMSISSYYHQLFVCDKSSTPCVHVLNSNNGDYLERIEMDYYPSSIELFHHWNNRHDEQVLIICDTQHVISIFQRISFPKRRNYEPGSVQTNSFRNHNQWKRLKKFSIQNSSKLTIASTNMIVDRASNTLIISDFLQNCIRIYSLETGELLKEFGQDHLIHPQGLTLNELNGELMVCDTSNHRVLVFK